MPQRSMSQRSSSLSRQSTADSDTDSALGSTLGPEPIKKSPREYIIPIAVEGGGYVTPRSGSLEPESKSNTPTSTSLPRSRFGRPRRMSSLLSDASEDESPFSALHRYNYHKLSTIYFNFSCMKFGKMKHQWFHIYVIKFSTETATTFCRDTCTAWEAPGQADKHRSTRTACLPGRRTTTTVLSCWQLKICSRRCCHAWEVLRRGWTSMTIGQVDSRVAGFLVDLETIRRDFGDPMNLDLGKLLFF